MIDWTAADGAVLVGTTLEAQLMLRQQADGTWTFMVAVRRRSDAFQVGLAAGMSPTAIRWTPDDAKAGAETVGLALMTVLEGASR